jgi:hypothetical protein
MIIGNPDTLYNIFVLVIILCASFFDVLIPCRLKNLAKNNIFIRHIFCYFTLIIFVVLSDDPTELKLFDHIFLRSLVLYFWFLLLIKTNEYIFILVIILLGLQYILVFKKRDYTDPMKRREVLKNTSKQEIEKRITHINTITDTLNYACVALIVGGVIYNFLHKYNKYKKNFDVIYFLFGGFEEC